VSGFVPLLATALQAATGGGSWSAALLLVVIALDHRAGRALAPAVAEPRPGCWRE